jgi:hypothetical protein
MAYTNLELLRKELADPYKSAFDQNSGDGETTVFKLSHKNVKAGSYSVYVGNDEQTETTEYSIDREEGIITFVTAPTSGVEIKVEYIFSAFSDEELTEFLSLENNNISKTLVRCIDILLMDAARRFDYSVGRADLKPSQVFDNLLRLRSILSNKSRQGSGISEISLVERTSRFYEDTNEQSTDLSRADR